MEFVVSQLKLCNCEKYIPLFEENGFHEEKYRNLRLTDLVKLIVEDGEVSVEKIWQNIINLRSTPSATDSVVKDEPTTSTETSIFGDEEVQVTQIISRAPMNLVWPPSSSVKEETITQNEDSEGQGRENIQDEIGTEPIEERTDNVSLNTNNSLEPINADAVDNYTEIVPKIEGRTVSLMDESFDPNDAETEAIVENGAPLNLPNSDVIVKIEGRTLNSPEDGNVVKQRGSIVKRSRATRRKRKSKMSDGQLSSSTTPAPKRRKSASTKSSTISLQYKHQRSNKIQILNKASLEQIIDIDKKHKELQICFNFYNLNQLDIFLQELVNVSSEFTNIEKLELKLPPKPKIYVGQSQLLLISAIAATFFHQLKSLIFGFGFYEDIDPNLITQLLNLCLNLEIFKAQRGIFGKEEKQLISIEIPQMNKLNKFRFAKKYAVPLVEIPKKPIEIDLEEEENKFYYHPLPFEINFSYHEFINLKEIGLGPHTGIKLENFGQFPQLNNLFVKHVWTNDFTHYGISNTITCLELPHQITDANIIRQIPSCFPYLTCLEIFHPSVACLRTLIHVMSGTKLKDLWIAVNYDFDGELTSALLGAPYTLTSTQDKEKLEQLRKYKYWEEFVKIHGIELPAEVDENNHVNPASTSSDQSQSPLPSLGSFKCLKKLVVTSSSREIRLPKNDYRWNQREVEYSNTEWSTGIRDFPMKPLWNEFIKLKPTLEKFELRYLRVLPEDSLKFKQTMGFKPETYFCEASPKLDWFSVQSLKIPSIKQEK